jgi:sporulation protein YlmC with PRC-barrel domain
MKRSLKNLSGYFLEGKDGTQGKVKDFLFDEETWVVRYVDADIKGFKKNQRVLIPRFFLATPDWQEKKIRVKLNRGEITSCPAIDEKKPVSREYERELNKHFSIEDYWPSIYSVPAGAGVFYPPRPIRIPTKLVNEKELDTSLRSFGEVKAYSIEGKGNRFGQVEDLIIDDEDWQVVYLVVDTSNWKPWSKSVVLSVDWLDSISYEKHEVSIDLEPDQIREAPEFNPAHPIGMDYEKALHDYYQLKFN